MKTNSSTREGDKVGDASAMSTSSSMRAALRPATHVIFDLDGLLLNTEHIYTQMTSGLLKKEGCKEGYSYQLKARLMGKGPLEVAQAIVDHYSLPYTAKEWSDKSRTAAKDVLPECELLPGATRLLHHLYKHKVPMAIATGSSDEAWAMKVGRHDKIFPGMFSHVVNSQDPKVKRSKPAPDVFSVCASKFEPAPASDSNCLAFEDSPNGVESALAAGMQVVMVPGPWVSEEMTKSATVRLKDLNLFRPEDFGLPPYEYRTDVTHVIFDMDGLLVDTHLLYPAATKTMLSLHGKEHDEGAFRAVQMKGRRHGEILAAVVAHYGLSVSPEALESMFNSTFKKLVPRCRLMPGVEKLVSHLHSKGVPMAVATSSSEEIYEAVSSVHKKVFSKFSHAVTGDDPDLERGKPAPDIFKACAKRFSGGAATPSRCLVFEDAVNGVEGAAAAGMQTVLVPEHNKLEPESAAKATQVLDKLVEFSPEDFGLPPFDLDETEN